MKFMHLAFTTLFLAILGMALPAHAQDYNRALESINQLNRIAPLQNPGFESADEILKNRVVDSKNKVVGEVKDVIIKDNGSITQLLVDFDRLRLGSQVFVNYRDMNARPSTNAYTLGLNEEQIRDTFPSMLANIESAAGEYEDNFSVRNVLGSEVLAQDGRRIGIVEDILFGANGGRVEAFYVSMKTDNLNGRFVAIPMTAVAIGTEGTRKTLTISNEQAAAMIDYAKKR